MRRRRALIAAASAVAVIATGTAAAAANFGLLRTNDKQLPAGHLDLATIQAGASLGPGTTAAGTIRVELVGGVVHILEPDGTEITVPLPTATSAAQTTTVAATADQADEADQAVAQTETTVKPPSTTTERRSTTTATPPSASTPHHDDSVDDHGAPEGHDDD
jgi:hypothetical protein